MSGRDTVKGTAPAYWASYLINGDASGLELCAKAEADAFAAWLGGPIVSCGEDEFFLRRHDATRFGVGGATCVEYVALVERPPQ